MRTDGLPMGALVDRKGDLYKSSPRRMLNNVAAALRVRLKLLKENRLAENAYLPMQLQKEAQQILRREWGESLEGRRFHDQVLNDKFMHTRSQYLVEVLR